MMTEVWPLMSEVELAIERVQEWMSPESGFRDTPWGFALNNPMVRKEPKGPGLIVTPWVSAGVSRELCRHCIDEMISGRTTLGYLLLVP